MTITTNDSTLGHPPPITEYPKLKNLPLFQHVPATAYSLLGVIEGGRNVRAVWVFYITSRPTCILTSSMFLFIIAACITSPSSCVSLSDAI